MRLAALPDLCETAAMTPAETSRKNLTDHDLPPGLLPENVTTVSFDAATGQFDLTLASEVQAVFGGYKVRYRTRLTGVMKTGRIEKLHGVQAKKGVWFPVTGMARDGASIAFQVGPITKRLPLSEFGGE